jgi:hypothetical protein
VVHLEARCWRDRAGVVVGHGWEPEIGHGGIDAPCRCYRCGYEVASIVPAQIYAGKQGFAGSNLVTVWLSSQKGGLRLAFLRTSHSHRLFANT